MIESCGLILLRVGPSLPSITASRDRPTPTERKHVVCVLLRTVSARRLLDTAGRSLLVTLGLMVRP